MDTPIPPPVGRPHAIYSKLIVASTGCTLDQTVPVLECMRNRYGTLDGLARVEFYRAARVAMKEARQLGWVK